MPQPHGPNDQTPESPPQARSQAPSRARHGEPLGGALPLFTLFGVRVSLHWTWFLFAMWELQGRSERYGTMIWNLAEFLGLFAIVLFHEFGHALACKSVGGQADRIVLWPLGGVAFVNPPQRPGAYLWSIVAGPLVNVLLLPLTVYGIWLWNSLNSAASSWQHFCIALGLMNGVMLAFNLLPVYPLDGGQILRGILWYIVGAVRSLQAASIVGIVGAVAMAGGIYWLIQDWWILLIGAFLVFQSLAGLKMAKRMLLFERVPRHLEYTCPNCGQSPPAGPVWRCERCGQAVDAFTTGSVCPNCGLVNQMTPCIWCGEAFPPARWQATRAHWTPNESPLTPSGTPPTGG